MDELILRDRIDAEGPHGMVAAVYRDYFRTAPYDRIAVDPEPARVPADRRVIAGGEKQFGLQARREGHWEPVTEHAVRYSQWTYFDAKPLIQWKSSDPLGRDRGSPRPGSCVAGRQVPRSEPSSTA